MLKAIFYARFHPERGPSVIHQFPKASARTQPDAEPLFQWSDISSYIIPPYDLCNRPLSICANGQRILGYPVSLEDAKYERNRFTFNVCFVLAEAEDTQPWQSVVRKAAGFFRGLEEEDGLLQAEEELEGLKWAGEDGYPMVGVGVVHSLLRSIVEELNTCGETCVQVNEVHVFNARLSNARPSTPRVHAWDVPLLIRALPEPEVWTWDLTLQRIYPHLDGVKHVQKIAETADVELRLVKSVVRELIVHHRAMLLDIFHFQAIYATKQDIALFLKAQDVQDECRKYISDRDSDGVDDSFDLPSRECVVDLYCSLQPGVTLADFCAAHKARLSSIDVRRFITFGIIKGFLRRIHKYALAIDPSLSASSRELHRRGGGTGSKPRSNEEVLRDFDRAWKRAVLSSGWATPPSGPPPGSLGRSQKSASEVLSEEDEKLKVYLDGTHCVDEMCVKMHMPEKRIVERLRSGRFGEVVLFNK